MDPILILVIGIAVVLGMIIVFRVNAFLALITAAIVVSIFAPGDMASKISRVTTAFGGTAASIGVLIAAAAIIGKCMMDSGSADRIVRFFMGVLGEKRGGVTMMASGFALSIPVFFDTVFYLLVPLARSMYRSTKKKYLLYIMAIAAGGAVTHTMVPPTPGPLVMADTLGVDVGVMMIMGAIIGLPAAFAGLAFSVWLDARMDIPMRPVAGETEELEPLDDSKLPSLFLAVLPIVIPIVLITTGSILTTIANGEHAARFEMSHIKDWSALNIAAQNSKSAPARRLLKRMDSDSAALLQKSGSLSDENKMDVIAGLNRVLVDREFYKYEPFVGVELSDDGRSLVKKDKKRMSVADMERRNRILIESSFGSAITPHVWDTPARKSADAGKFFGNPSFALLLAAGAALLVYIRQRKPSREEITATVETALMSGGVIILITAAGGAFGAMLGAAKIGPAIEEMFGGQTAGGVGLLCLAFLLTSLLKFAQGSSTVAMITGASMMAAMIDPSNLGFNAVYLATAVGAGSLVGSWMNDSGFWIYCKMGGLTEAETLRSWTPLLAVCGVVAMIVTVILSLLVPLV
jgi:GntP family gluconate:H+ symporter